LVLLQEYITIHGPLNVKHTNPVHIGFDREINIWVQHTRKHIYK